MDRVRARPNEGDLRPQLVLKLSISADFTRKAFSEDGAGGRPSSDGRPHADRWPRSGNLIGGGAGGSAQSLALQSPTEAAVCPRWRLTASSPHCYPIPQRVLQLPAGAAPAAARVRGRGVHGTPGTVVAPHHDFQPPYAPLSARGAQTRVAARPIRRVMRPRQRGANHPLPSVIRPSAPSPRGTADAAVRARRRPSRRTSPAAIHRSIHPGQQVHHRLAGRAQRPLPPERRRTRSQGQSASARLGSPGEPDLSWPARSPNVGRRSRGLRCGPPTAPPPRASASVDGRAARDTQRGERPPAAVLAAHRPWSTRSHRAIAGATRPGASHVLCRPRRTPWSKSYELRYS